MKSRSSQKFQNTVEKIAQHPKPLMLALGALSFLLILSTQTSISFTLFAAGITAGIATILLLNTAQHAIKRLENKELRKVTQALFLPESHLSLAGVLTSSLLFYGLLELFTQTENMYDISTLLISMLLGGSCAVAVVNVVNPTQLLYRPHRMPYFFEMLAATVVGSMILAANLSDLNSFQEHSAGNGGVKFVLEMVIAGTILLIIREIARNLNKDAEKPVWMFMAIVFTAVIGRLAIRHLPESWVMDGYEYHATELSAVLLISAVLIGYNQFFIKMYDYCSQLYISYILHEPDKNFLRHQVFRLIINGIIGYLPVACALAIFILGFVYGGLFGLTVVALEVLFISGTDIVVDSNKLTTNNMSNLGYWEKKKIDLISPQFHKWIIREFRTFYHV